MNKYRRALHLLAFLSPFLFRFGVVEDSAAGTAETKPGADAAPAPAADAKPKASLTASDFMAKLTAAFSAKETLAKENTELKTKLAAVEKARDEAKAAQAAAETAKAAAESAKAAADTSLANANTALANVATAVGVKPEEIAGKSAEDVQKVFNARIEARSGERLAELGFPVGGLPPSAESGSKGGSGDELADIQAELATTKDPKRAGELAARANKLRDAKWNSGGSN
jgi:hypothetical protein